MNIYVDLFLTFARVGGFTFGGGYAMLPMLEKEIVENKKWATSEELMDYFAVGQCTPGVIAVNTATFVGNSVGGIPGGIIATLGVVSPSLVIISLIAAFLTNFQDNVYVQMAFNGIRVCVCVLIINALVKLVTKSVIDKITLGIFLIVVIGSIFFDVSPIAFVIFSAVAGIVVKLIESRGDKQC